MSVSTEQNRDLIILEHIEQDPDATQASLAAKVGVAVGTVNWHLRRLIEKGYVKATRMERKKLRYIITPEGIALRARLTMDYIDSSLKMYRLVRQRMVDTLNQIQRSGYKEVELMGKDGDVMDICKLTCIEHNIDIVGSGKAPKIEIIGLKMHIHWNKEFQVD